MEAAAESSPLKAEVRRLISLLLTQHVRGWYSQVTQDEELFTQFHDLFDHVHLTLAGRVQAQDWNNFALHQLPDIVLRHLEDLNIAKDRVRPNLDLEESFLKLQSHRGVEDQDTYLMNISDALLVVLLPENELVSDLAYGFTRELLSELILKTLIERLSEPWFWDELMLKYQDALDSINWKTATFQALSAAFAALLVSPSSRAADTRCRPDATVLEGHKSPIRHFESLLGHVYHGRFPDSSSIYDTALPGIIRELFKSSKSTFFHQIVNDVVIPAIDLICGGKLMDSMRNLVSFASGHQSMTRIVKFVRIILFPDDEPSPSRVVPTKEEQVHIRSQVQARLPEALRSDFARSKLINKVLILNIFDAILGTIFPELQRRSPEQLKEKVVRIRQANLEATGDGGIHTVKSPKVDDTAHIQEDHSIFYVQPSPTLSVASENDFSSNAPSPGLESMHAMRRSFEVKRRHDFGQ